MRTTGCAAAGDVTDGRAVRDGAGRLTTDTRQTGEVWWFGQRSRYGGGWWWIQSCPAAPAFRTLGGVCREYTTYIGYCTARRKGRGANAWHLVGWSHGYGECVWCLSYMRCDWDKKSGVDEEGGRNCGFLMRVDGWVDDDDVRKLEQTG